MLEEDPDREAARAGVEDRLGDDLGVDLLDRDVERLLRPVDEVDDDLLEVV
jgi:hypothetical protein